MGNIKVNLVITFIIIGLSSCSKFELRGFYTSYEHVNQRFEQSIEWNNKHGYSEITIPQTTYTLHVMGDSHVGGTKNLVKFFQKALDENAAAVVMVGDITTGHKEDYDILSDHLPGKDSLLYFALAGNHDIYFDGWKSFYSLFGSSTYMFVVNTPDSSDLFICLDTSGGTLGGKQLDWLNTQLETHRKNHRHCTVFTHNNLLRLRPTTSTNPMVIEIHVLLDLFLKHNVNLVVSGHDHIQNSDRLGITTFITMDALQDSNHRASNLKLTINEENIRFSFDRL